MNNPNTERTVNNSQPDNLENLKTATWRHMKSLTFDQKLAWLDAAREAMVARYGEEAVQRNDGFLEVPIYRIPTPDNEQSFFFPADQIKRQSC